MIVKKLITKKEINDKIQKLSENIFKEFGNEYFIILSVLNGSFVFVSDLSRELSKYTVNFEIHFIRLKSYSGKKSSGMVKWYDDLPDIKGKNLLIVEDILDSGLTLNELYHKIQIQKPLKCKIAVLLEKNIRRVDNIKADFIGFSVDDKFVVGYGLDYNEKYRGLPYIGYIDTETMEK